MLFLTSVITMSLNFFFPYNPMLYIYYLTFIKRTLDIYSFNFILVKLAVYLESIPETLKKKKGIDAEERGCTFA